MFYLARGGGDKALKADMAGYFFIAWGADIAKAIANVGWDPELM